MKISKQNSNLKHKARNYELKIGQLPSSPYIYLHIIWIAHDMFHDAHPCFHYEMIEDLFLWPFLKSASMCENLIHHKMYIPRYLN